jgi:hypothetical protein
MRRPATGRSIWIAEQLTGDGKLAMATNGGTIVWIPT